MKRSKTAFFIALIAAFQLISTVEAAPKSKAKTQQIQKKEEQPVDNENLKFFNANLGIRFVGKEVKLSEDGSYTALMKYELENKGKDTIRAINWEAVFSYRGQMIYSQDVPLDLGEQSPLLGGQKLNINIEVNENALSPQLWLNLTYPYFSVTATSIPKELIFANGARIIVK